MAEEAIAAGRGGGKGVRNYLKAHWKELLALTLAAIPAVWIISNWGGSRKTAASVITLQPDGASMSGAANGTAIPPADTGAPAKRPKPPVAAHKAAQAIAIPPMRQLPNPFPKFKDWVVNVIPGSSEAGQTSPSSWPFGKSGNGLKTSVNGSTGTSVRKPASSSLAGAPANARVRPRTPVRPS